MSQILENRVLKILETILDLSEEDLSLESSMEDIEEWDSVKMMEIVLALEEEFDLYFSETQLEEMIDMRSIISAIKDSIQNE